MDRNQPSGLALVHTGSRALPASQGFPVPAWVSSQECEWDPIPKAGEGGAEGSGQRLPPCLCPGPADQAFEPWEETPPPVCASAAWPTAGLELASFKLLTPPFSSRGPGQALPLGPFPQLGKGSEQGTASGHCADFRGCAPGSTRERSRRQEPLRHCAQVEEQLPDSRLRAKDGDRLYRQVKDPGRVRGPGFGFGMAEPLEFGGTGSSPCGQGSKDLAGVPGKLLGVPVPPFPYEYEQLQCSYNCAVC